MEKKKRILAKDLVGKEYNGFQVLDCKTENRRTYLYVVCPFCKCKKWMRKDSLDNKKVFSCGCQNKKNNYYAKKDISGKKFGKLTVLHPTKKRNPFGSVIWLCKCDCGNEKEIPYNSLVAWNSKSCGCIRTNLIKELAGKSNELYCIEGTSISQLYKKIPSNNTSGFKGVVYKKDRSKWVAQIEFKGKNYNLGSYDKKEDAIEARKIAEENLFGNFIDWYAENYPEKWKKIKKMVDK